MFTGQYTHTHTGFLVYVCIYMYVWVLKIFPKRGQKFRFFGQKGRIGKIEGLIKRVKLSLVFIVTLSNFTFYRISAGSYFSCLHHICQYKFCFMGRTWSYWIYLICHFYKAIVFKKQRYCGTLWKKILISGNYSFSVILVVVVST